MKYVKNVDTKQLFNQEVEKSYSFLEFDLTQQINAQYHRYKSASNSLLYSLLYYLRKNGMIPGQLVVQDSQALPVPVLT